MESTTVPVGNVIFLEHPSSLQPLGEAAGKWRAVLGKVLRSFQLFQDKSSAGNLEDPFIPSFFLPPGELADIFGLKFVLKYAQCSGGAVSILSCLLKNVIVCVLSLSLFFAPKFERNRRSLSQPPLELLESGKAEAADGGGGGGHTRQVQGGSKSVCQERGIDREPRGRGAGAGSGSHTAWRAGPSPKKTPNPGTGWDETQQSMNPDGSEPGVGCAK